MLIPFEFSFLNKYNLCLNPNLGLVTKTRACKNVGQKEYQEAHLILSGV